MFFTETTRHRSEHCGVLFFSKRFLRSHFLRNYHLSLINIIFIKILLQKSKCFLSFCAKRSDSVWPSIENESLAAPLSRAKILIGQWPEGCSRCGWLTMVVGSCVLLLGLTSGSCAGPNNSTTPLRLGWRGREKTSGRVWSGPERSSRDAHYTLVGLVVNIWDGPAHWFERRT